MISRTPIELNPNEIKALKALAAKLGMHHNQVAPRPKYIPSGKNQTTPRTDHPRHAVGTALTAVQYDRLKAFAESKGWSSSKTIAYILKEFFNAERN